MTHEQAAERLRRFLLLVSTALFAGTPVELWFTGHTESALQLVPFVLCGVGFLACVLGLSWPTRPTFIGLRVVMILIALGGAFGLYEHVAHNFAFEREIRPGATTSEVFWEALRGASPLLAPGVLTVAAVLAIAGTYEHPAIGHETGRGEGVSVRRT